MSPTGEKEKVKRTMVKIENTIYARVKAKAAEKGQNIQTYVNDLLLMNVEKDEFLKKYAPHFSATVGEHAIYIYDSKKDKSFEIRLKDVKPVCITEESDSCEHIRFALAIPEVGRIVALNRLIKKFKDEGKL
jgi:hypothetical protein